MINNLGEKLKSARIQNKLSRKVIAERTGVSVSMIGLYESNVRQPSLSNLVILTSRIFTTQTVYHSLSPYSLINLFTAVLGESLFISNLFFTPILE